MTVRALVAGLALSAAVLLSRRPRRSAARRVRSMSAAAIRAHRPPPDPVGRGGDRRRRLPADPVRAGAAAALGWALVDGGSGPGLAGRCAAAAVATAVLARLLAVARRDRDRAARRSALARQLPVAVDLLSACLDAGCTVPAALSAVTGAMPGPVAAALSPVARSLALGADPATAWRDASGEPMLAPLCRTLVRAGAGGVPASGLLVRAGDDLRETARADAARRAQTVGVRTVLPLGLCFLPAFVLLGVVPTVVGLLAGAL